MSQATYVRYEIVRTARNRRFLILSLIFPLILFYFIAGENRHVTLDGVNFPLYYMTGMAAWGSMNSVIASGARIAADRKVGWTRQMRVTPLRPSVYFTAKITSGYLMALLTIVVLAIAGVTLGVHLRADQWLGMLGYLLIGLVPFAIMGVMLGHLLSVDTLGPVVGGGTALFALLGGAWGPLASGGTFLDVVRLLPSYWLVQAGKSALGGANVWPLEAWLVLGVWSVALAVIGARVYQRDTTRV